jgi:hypothetical protein
MNLHHETRFKDKTLGAPTTMSAHTTSNGMQASREHQTDTEQEMESLGGRDAGRESRHGSRRKRTSPALERIGVLGGRMETGFPRD